MPIKKRQPQNIAGYAVSYLRLFFIGPGVAEFTHFIFPLLKPDILPDVGNTLSQNVKETFVANMPNYWFGVTRKYFFPGMYTAILPMVPGIYAIYTIIKASKNVKRS